MARKRRSSSFRMLVLMLFFFVLLGFYMWGSVQINLVILENDNLLSEKEIIMQQVNELRMQMNRMKSYQRIAPLARNMGLLPVPAVMLDEIAVDFEEQHKEKKKSRVQYAGFIGAY